MAREDLLLSIAGYVGDPIEVFDPRDAWPGKVRVATDGGDYDVALHVSRTGSHARKSYERRFQNPGDRRPVRDLGGAIPILVGLDGTKEDPILVCVDGRSRVGREARFSILYNGRIITEATKQGWSDYVSGTGEHIFALKPPLFPILVDAFDKGIEIPTLSLTEAIDASGLLDEDDSASAERARRTGSALVRDAKFGKDVKDAYGHKCAMCELTLGLVVGAHVYPVNAPKSPDRVWNGISLCQNHHKAFDDHRLWIGRDYRTEIHEDYKRVAEAEPAARRFLETTRGRILLPANSKFYPRADMLAARYDYYPDEYSWAPTF